jgi:hypothetical protein
MLVNHLTGGKMAIPSQFLYRDVSFHPPEADRLADKIADSIRKLTSGESKVDTSVHNMSLEWEGHHKEMFISDANPHQKKGGASIEYLKRQETFFRNLRVTRQEAYTNPAWEAYTKGKH